jgi:DAK2 domain fusion protein YloV
VDRTSIGTFANAALQNLEAHRRRIDDLNVYPVPDGDTGTNLLLTVRGVVEALEGSDAEDHAALARELSRAALMSARGNSGVILSQIVRGFADVVGSNGGATVPLLARAFRSASDAAYGAMKEPVEGTILTVIREMAEEAEKGSHDGLAPADFLRVVLERGEAALARTPELLDVLGEAGVVDAGGAGLVEIVRGITLAAAGEPLPDVPVETVPLGVAAIHQELSRYRYCTTFVVEGEELDVPALERSLESLGDSLLVVGDRSALKVHVHTDDPGAALSAGTAVGVIEEVEIANMHLQTISREERLLGGTERSSVSELETGLVAVCQGAGVKRLFEGLGATIVIEGGQTMNPSAAEIVAAIEAVPAPEVIVLPNNANVVLAAEQASELTSKKVRVVPSRSVQAGFAAMVPFLSTSSPDENERTMRGVLESIATGDVTVASRDARLDGVDIRKGSYIGLVDGSAVMSGDEIEPVARAVIDRLLDPQRSWLGILTGEGAPSLEGLLAAVGAAHPEVDVEAHDGGQPHYPLLMVAE